MIHRFLDKVLWDHIRYLNERTSHMFGAILTIVIIFNLVIGNIVLLKYFNKILTEEEAPLIEEIKNTTCIRYDQKVYCKEPSLSILFE